MLTMWVRSVSMVMCSFSAMSLLSRPSPRACSTCFSRGVSFSIALWASYSSWRLRLTIRSISITSAGDSRASPDLSRRTASTTSPIAADLCSTPAAPASTALAKRAGSRLALRTSVITSRSEEHTSELQSHSDLHSFPTRRSSDLAYRGRLVQHAGGACLDGLSEAGRLQAGAKDQRHHVGTGSQLFDQLEPISVRQRKVYDRDVHPVGHLAHERTRLGQRACLARHDELLLPLEHEGQRLSERCVVLDEQDPGRILPSAILYDSHPSNASMPVHHLTSARKG